MTAHVAEASERSGRVLLWIDPAEHAALHGLEAAVRLAEAYASAVETVVVMPEWLDPTVPVPSGRVAARKTRAPFLPDGTPGKLLDMLAARHRRTVEAMAERRAVAVEHTSATGDAIDCIAELCMKQGPWNVIALSRAVTVDSPHLLSTLLANVSGATGILVVGRKLDTRRADRVVVVVEDAERLPSMLRAADRLAGPDGSLIVVLGLETPSDHANLEAHVRLLTAHLPNVQILDTGPTYAVGGVIAERIRRLKPGLVIARFGGIAFHDGRELARATAVAHCPFLLVR